MFLYWNGYVTAFIIQVIIKVVFLFFFFFFKWMHFLFNTIQSSYWIPVVMTNKIRMVRVIATRTISTVRDVEVRAGEVARWNTQAWPYAFNCTDQETCRIVIIFCTFPHTSEVYLRSRQCRNTRRASESFLDASVTCLSMILTCISDHGLDSHGKNRKFIYVYMAAHANYPWLGRKAATLRF